MSFTDDDLKRLREGVKSHQDVCRCTCKTGQVETIEALIARLEAAEWTIEATCGEQDAVWKANRDAWLKASGKNHILSKNCSCDPKVISFKKSKGEI